MKTVIAVDSFKGCMTSMDSGKILQQAIKDVYPEDEVEVFPLADGGEGTVDAMTQGLHGRIVKVPVTGPLGSRIESRYGFLPDSKMAIIEMADASGLTLVPPEKRNPLYTTTYGLGELILAAINKGCRRFIIGIGGSATNDCGLGMLTALGFHFLKKDGIMAGIKGSDLAEINKIDLSHADPRLKDCRFEIACDVTNPLCGPEGCSNIFGPQKGATEAIIKRMDQDIHHFAELAEKTTGMTGLNLPGAGAAGGLGFAFHVFLHGTLTPGVALILSAIGIKKSLADADVFITGEGRMDQQTAMGKAPAGAAQLAKACRPECLTVALCGSATPEAEKVNEHGIDAYFPILHAPMTVEEAMKRPVTERNLRQTVQQVMHLLHHKNN